MTRSLSPAVEAIREATPPGCHPATHKQYFDVPFTKWFWDIAFMLSLALTGLAMPLGNLLVVVLLAREFKTDREGFVVKLTLAMGGYAMTRPITQWGVNLLFPMFLVAVTAMCVLRKTPPLKKSIAIYTVYALAVAFLAIKGGLEGFSVQIRLMLAYLSFCFYAVILLCFAGRDFDMHRMWQTVFTLMMIMCVFYILDGFVLRGWVLVPCSWINYDGDTSTFFSPIFSGPGGQIPRKYQPGLYMLLVLAYPLGRYYKLRWWQWLLVLGAFGACRTFSFIVAFFIGLVLAQGTLKKYLLYGLGAVALFTVLYFVDDSMGYSETEQSTLRIASSVNQFFDLTEIEDDEDLSEAGTGRMAQALPALEQLYNDDRQWTGYGFVPVETENPRLIVYCEFIADPTMRNRAVTDVEINVLYQLLSLGYLGLALWVLFIAGMWWVIRRMKYAPAFMNVTISTFICGLSMVDLCSSPQGNYLGALVFASVLLANRPGNKESEPEECLQPTTKE